MVEMYFIAAKRTIWRIANDQRKLRMRGGNMDRQMLSTGKDDWGTPQKFFDDLDNEFHFTLDVCANEKNYKVPRFFSESDNGLDKEWNGETVFCNPPYSKKKKGSYGQSDWIKKCYEQHVKHGITVVMLIPSRTDTLVFHNYILGKSEIRFLKGRLKFEIDRIENKDPAPFPSMVVIYENGRVPNVVGM